MLSVCFWMSCECIGDVLGMCWECVGAPLNDENDQILINEGTSLDHYFIHLIILASNNDSCFNSYIYLSF